MCRAMATGIVFTVLLAAGAPAQVPPKYEIVQVTDNPYYEAGPRMNNRGQFVFGTWFDTSDHRTQEIFLYDNGQLIQLTDDYVQDAGHDINDDGTIVWARGIGPIDPETGLPTLEIVIYEGGEITRLTDNAAQDSGAKINNFGQVVWTTDMGEVCGGHVAMDIFFYDGQEIHQITTDALSDEVANQGAQINDFGDIVWTRYDFCVDPYESDIMMCRDGVSTQMSPDDTPQPRGVTINNTGQMAWTFQIGWGEHGIQLWDNGVVTLFTEWGGGPHLNDLGDMYFHRWYESESTYQAWLYRHGRFYQLSDDPFWNTTGDINNAGEAAWGSGNYPWKDIRLLRQLPPGAPDTGGKLDALEVRPFSP